jgi:hypothetical protein
MGALDGAAGRVGAARDSVSRVGEELKDRAGGALESVHGRVGDLQATIADTLDTGAETIRDRIGSGSAGPGSRLGGAGESVAGGLERSAYWLRENDLGDIGTFLRQQLRDHPGRSALVALGFGILIGRSSRR